MSERLHRSLDDRMLAGVAGGLAEMWDADPSLVRLVWALLVIFTGGIALLVYIVMAIVVPEEGDENLHRAAPPPPAPGSPSDPGASSPAAPSGSPVTPPAPPAPPVSGTPPPTYWLPGTGPSRADTRAARRAARREARRQRGDGSAPVLIGVFLVLLGGFFLAREWIPDLNWNWFWPVLLIAFGVLLLVMAIGRRPSDPGGPS